MGQVQLTEECDHWLPSELWLEIFLYLPIEDIVHGIRLVSSSWKAAVDSKYLWKTVLGRDDEFLLPPGTNHLSDLWPLRSEEYRFWKSNQYAKKYISRSPRFREREDFRFDDETNDNVKCIVVGDVCSDKTAMLASYTRNSYDRDYVPTVFDNFTATELWRDRHVCLGLWDTSGQEDVNRLRPLSYPGTNVFIIAFSLVDPESLEHVGDKWVPELREHAPGVPFLLVGTKVNRRDAKEGDREVVTWQQGERVAEEIGASGYFECSARTQSGLKEIFQEAIRVGLETDRGDRGGTKRKGFFSRFLKR